MGLFKRKPKKETNPEKEANDLIWDHIYKLYDVLKPDILNPEEEYSMHLKASIGDCESIGGGIQAYEMQGLTIDQGIKDVYFELSGIAEKIREKEYGAHDN